MSERRIPLAGVIGDPIAHSKSPRIHGHWLHKLGIEGYYIPLHVTSGALREGFDHMRALGFVGANVTIPHKEVAREICTDLSDAAAAIGAVNTVVFHKDGGIYGHNTDAYGFVANIKSALPNWSGAGKNALVIGAGGAARAIIYALKQEKFTNITIVNRTYERAAALAEEFGVHSMEWSERNTDLDQYHFIVNTSSLGMVGQPELDITLPSLLADVVVTDIVYNPLETPLLAQARAHGAQVVDGFGMLLHQAVPGFELWFHARPVVDDELRRIVLS